MMRFTGPDRGLLTVQGADARDFLQGLLTIDMAKLVAGRPRYGLLLSPQGKFLHDFFCSAQSGSFWLEAENTRLADLAARLKMYRLRAKVEIEPMAGKAVFAAWGDAAPAAPPPEAQAFADPRLPALGWRIYAPAAAGRAWLESLGADAADAAAYEAHRLALGIPDGSRDLIPDRSLPFQFGLERLGAIDFDKGCYVGQEVTARSQRAAIRKRLFHVRAEKELPPPGTPVKQAGAEVGEMRSSLQGQGLALLQAEAAEKAAEAPLAAGGIPLSATLPKWLNSEDNFPRGESAGAKPALPV